MRAGTPNHKPSQAGGGNWSVLVSATPCLDRRAIRGSQSVYAWGRTESDCKRVYVACNSNSGSSTKFARELWIVSIQMFTFVRVVCACVCVCVCVCFQ